MKKATLFLITLLSIQSIFAQEKFALVIGNANYSGISPLKNSVNDANDMESTLENLGFNVDKVLNGNLEQMENAVDSFSRRLKNSSKSYGFFFYAGHGVQSNGENYLIPVNANNIQSETQLRERTVSLGFIMEKLEDAGNELNIIVLDACRDNPFSFSRSGSRGLSVVSHSPPGSITMYATSAGSVASDGTDKNGIFTSCLLNNLKLPNLEVNEVFRRTMRDVENATKNQQRPAMYNQFSGQAYLGSSPPQKKDTYLVGEVGPAGGYIFFAEETFRDGWRYLEAAPVNTEIKNLKWGAYGVDVPGTILDLGSGKNNTKIIVEYLKSVNRSGTAAQICEELNYNGYNDWFLPSRDELQWMYVNLHAKGLGNFKNARYWSSSQYNSTHAWYIHFGDNGRASNNYDKDRQAGPLWLFSDNIFIRAIRAF